MMDNKPPKTICGLADYLQLTYWDYSLNHSRLIFYIKDKEAFDVALSIAFLGNLIVENHGYMGTGIFLPYYITITHESLMQWTK